MYRVLLVLTIVIVLLVGPSLSVLASPAQGGGGGITDCRYSEDTQFGAGGALTGQIADRFSTLRSSPGDPSMQIILAPATFNVLDQGCFGGFSWVQIEYTSGTICEAIYYYSYYNDLASCNDGDATGLVGWALESQIYYDGTYGPGRWLEAAIS